MYKGTIIENSLKDPRILNLVKIEKSWKAGSWILHEVSIDEESAKEFGAHLASGPWYVHFWKLGEDEVLVVFKDKTFSILYSDPSTWTEAISYGKLVGIPEEQLTFVIPESNSGV